MNLSHLRYFVRLAETRHYTKAAEQMYISQPSLSHAIAQLEQELGVPLFEKNGRNVELTRFGEEFLKQVRQSLEILDDSIDYMHRIAAGNGIVRLGLLRTLGIEYVPSLAAQFKRQNADKNVDFTFFTGVTSDIMHKLQRHELDVVLSSRAPDEYKFESIPVKKQDLVLIVPPDHRLAAQHTAELSEVLDDPFIQYTSGSGLRHVINDMFAQINASPNIAYEIQEDQVIAGLVAQGFGVAVVPYMEMLLRLNVKILQISRPVPNRMFYLVTDPTMTLSPAAENFKRFVLEHSEKP